MFSACETSLETRGDVPTIVSGSGTIETGNCAMRADGASNVSGVSTIEMGACSMGVAASPTGAGDWKTGEGAGTGAAGAGAASAGVAGNGDAVTVGAGE
jgi:hypothetical protein